MVSLLADPYSNRLCLEMKRFVETQPGVEAARKAVGAVNKRVLSGSSWSNAAPNKWRDRHR